jgi:hypothetical protein
MTSSATSYSSRVCTFAFVAMISCGASAEIAVSANDGKQVLADGVQVVPQISLLSIDGTEVSLAPETIASGLRPYQIDTAGPRRYAIVGNIGGGGRDIDTISLIDLAPPVPRVVDTAAVGLTPEGVKMSPDGRYAAVNVNNGSNAAHGFPLYHATGLLQVWHIGSGKLQKVAEAPVGGWGQGIVWSQDARTLLVQCMIGQHIEIFTFDGRRLRHTTQVHMPAGPAGIRTAER